MWFERHLSSSITTQCRFKPAVLLTGARQTGKSSLLRRLFPTANYVSLDNPSVADEAEFNPRLFLQKFVPPIVIDEIQYAPKLFRELKVIIDDHRDLVGQFLITGSQHFPLMRGVAESLAGRVSIFDLSTLGAAEIRAAGKSPEPLLQRGGFPELWVHSEQQSQQFFEDYLLTYLERDLRSILAVDSLRTFDRFLRSLALRTGNLLNLSELGRDVGIAANTAGRWIDTLIASGIVHLLEPWFSMESKRIVKTPKLFFRDNGLLCYLLRIPDLTSLSQHAMQGAIWENFVFNELQRYLDSNGSRRNLWFWRDKDGGEVDFVVENGDGITLIESKNAERVDARGLNFRKFLKNNGVSGKVATAVACRHTQIAPALTEQGWIFNPLHTEPAFLAEGFVRGQ